MEYTTFVCNICGKEGLSKRTSFVNGTGRACREHEEVERPTSKGRDLNKTYFGIKIDPRCPEVGYSTRVLSCMHAFEDSHSIGLMEIAMDKLVELSKQPEHACFVTKVFPPKIVSVGRWSGVVHEYSDILLKNMESALYDKEVIKDYIQKEVIPFCRRNFCKDICLPATADLPKILNPIRMSDYYEPNKDHKAIRDLMIAMGTLSLRLNDKDSIVVDVVCEYRSSIKQALEVLKNQGFQMS